DILPHRITLVVASFIGQIVAPSIIGNWHITDAASLVSGPESTFLPGVCRTSPNRNRTLSALGEYSSPIASPGHEERLPLNGIGLRTLGGIDIYHNTKTIICLFETFTVLAKTIEACNAYITLPEVGVPAYAYITTFPFHSEAPDAPKSLTRPNNVPSCVI